MSAFHYSFNFLIFIDLNIAHKYCNIHEYTQYNQHMLYNIH